MSQTMKAVIMLNSRQQRFDRESESSPHFSPALWFIRSRLAAFSPQGGGDETRITAYSNLEVTTGSQIRDAAIELAQKWTPDEVPTHPKRLPLTGQPWTYGNVPPQ